MANGLNLMIIQRVTNEIQFFYITTMFSILKLIN
jgi:hypothetical protein